MPVVSVRRPPATALPSSSVAPYGSPKGEFKVVARAKRVAPARVAALIPRGSFVEIPPSRDTPPRPRRPGDDVAFLDRTIAALMDGAAI